MPWVGTDAVKALFEKVLADSDAAAKEIVSTAAATVVAESMKNFSGTRKRVAAHYVPTMHTGGDKPNVITGSLRRSIRADPITKYGTSSYGTVVAPRMIYARRVELGMYGGDAYPFFEPGVRSASATFEVMAKAIWKKHLAV